MAVLSAAMLASAPMPAHAQAFGFFSFFVNFQALNIQRVYNRNPDRAVEKISRKFNRNPDRAEAVLARMYSNDPDTTNALLGDLILQDPATGNALVALLQGNNVPVSPTY